MGIWKKLVEEKNRIVEESQKLQNSRLEQSQKTRDDLALEVGHQVIFNKGHRGKAPDASCFAGAKGIIVEIGFDKKNDLFYRVSSKGRFLQVSGQEAKTKLTKIIS